MAVTEGILRLLSSEELAGVLAHELAHIKNRDILIGTIAAVLAGVITYIAHMAQWAAMFGGFAGNDDDDDGGALGLIAMAVLAPIAAVIIQLAISRSREYLADATGATIAGSASGLAGALEKLDHASKRVPLQSEPTTAHMFIVKPFSGSALMNLFSTHPPIGDRIRRLRAMTAY